MRVPAQRQNVSAENYGTLLQVAPGGGTKTLLAGTTSVAGDLTIAPSTTFAAAADNFSLAGDRLNNGGYSSSTGQTVAFNGLGTQNIGGSATTTFNTLALTGQQLSLANGMTFPMTMFSIMGRGPVVWYLGRHRLWPRYVLLHALARYCLVNAASGRWSFGANSSSARLASHVRLVD